MTQPAQILVSFHLMAYSLVISDFTKMLKQFLTKNEGMSSGPEVILSLNIFITFNT